MLAVKSVNVRNNFKEWCERGISALNAGMGVEHELIEDYNE